MSSIRSTCHDLKRRTVWGVLSLMIATGSWGCSKEQPAARDAQPSSGPGPLAQMLADLAPAGWKLSDQVTHFTPENLYEKINGRAELFIAYDVVSLTFASFEHATDPERFIDVSVYDMGTVTNAFGIFSVERSPSDPPVALGRAACRSDANVYVWKDQYYITVIASDTTDALQRISMDLARKITDRLPDTGGRVWGRTALPQANRVPRSIRYFQVDAMGLDFMRNTYTAQYRKGDAVVTVFLSRPPSPAAAQATTASYLKHAKQYGKGVEHLTVNGVDLDVCDMGKTYDVIFQKDRLIAGVTAIKNRSLALQAATDLWRQLGND